MFKVGDKVKILSVSDGIFHERLGNVYAIKRISDRDGITMYHFKEDFWVTGPNIELYNPMNRNGANS